MDVIKVPGVAQARSLNQMEFELLEKAEEQISQLEKKHEELQHYSNKHKQILQSENKRLKAENHKLREQLKRLEGG